MSNGSKITKMRIANREKYDCHLIFVSASWTSRKADEFVPFILLLDVREEWS